MCIQSAEQNTDFLLKLNDDGRGQDAAHRVR